MIASVKYNLANLGNFNGRDARSTFWWYMLFLVLIQFVLGLITQIPMYAEMFGSAIEAAQNGVDPADMNAAMAANIGDTMRTATYLGTGVTVLASALFVASFVRRLHDSGKPGWIAILALAPVLYTAITNALNIDELIEMTQSMMTQSDPNVAMGDQSRLYFSSILGWVGYLVTIIFGVLESDDGPNKYGEQPVSLG
ncbi:MAG: DUF805 domain-containing protein [Sphingomonadaceae bacterium]|nr:DUF805 domain-containing protein [Sphingomonadaceae bacterium]MCP5385051.1 DUF805 domain-containing protein [Altererythrobacter sp.]MCP5391980.1 DUF805 domain-containing protein [Sphingomonadaceae bacterium]MCP5394104.1 DUF805 domain-containing protein [Sphingomonadaceae bacterium]